MRGVRLALLLCALAPACTDAALRRQVEQLRNELTELRREQHSHRVRSEETANRLLILEEELTKGRSAAPTSAEAPPPLPVVRLRPKAPEAAEIEVSPPAASAPPTPAPAPKAPPAVPVLPAKPLYARGLAAFRSGNRELALAIFRAFIARFPDHPLADNSYYWSGRAHTENGDRAAAREAYETLLKRYPTGNKVPDTLIALAELLADAGRREEARAQLTRVVETFPASEAAKVAARRLREIKP
jgi:tol-pal system protein YbgF